MTEAKDQITFPKLNVHDHGYVTLVDTMPSIDKHTQGLGLETAIVESARMSYGKEVQDIVGDKRLIRYLYKNGHTSPFERVKFSFVIQCPKFVAIQLIRHRTANVNEFSQRYTEVDLPFFNPVNVDGSIRLQDKVNKQGSIESKNCEASDEIHKELDKINGILEDVKLGYHKLIDLGVAKEVARYCLPMSTYTRLSYTMDLHNLLKFFSLRLDPHAQKETRDYVQAMYDLIKDLIPITIKAYNDFTKGSIKLSLEEIQAIKNKDSSLKNAGKAETIEFQKKLNQLGLDFTNL